MFSMVKKLYGLAGCILSISYTLTTSVDDVVVANPIESCDSVGDVIEQMIRDFIHKTCGNMVCKGPPNQSPDIFVLSPLKFLPGMVVRFVEVKAFTKTPGFDIGNFDSYCDALAEEGGVKKKLFETVYLIVEYECLPDSTFKIKDVQTKYVWQLPSYDLKYPITLQVKRGVVYNIRPGVKSSWDCKTKTPKRFIQKIEDTMKLYNHSTEKIKSIKDQFQQLQ